MSVIANYKTNEIIFSNNIELSNRTQLMLERLSKSIWESRDKYGYQLNGVYHMRSAVKNLPKEYQVEVIK